MQETKSSRLKGGPWRRRVRWIGADAEFAKAMARAEFGRFYTDDSREREVARSMARAKARREPAQKKARAPREAPADPTPPRDDPKGGTKHALWRAPRARELKQLHGERIEQAKARLLERDTPDDTQGE